MRFKERFHVLVSEAVQAGLSAALSGEDFKDRPIVLINLYPGAIVESVHGAAVVGGDAAEVVERYQEGEAAIWRARKETA